MKLTAYKKLLTMSKEAVDAALAIPRTNSMKKKGELEVAKLDERLATLQTDIDVLCSQKELNFDSIIDKLDECALAERRQKQFREIIEQLFPDLAE